MSSAAGFSPNIMAVPKAEFEKLRAEFATLNPRKKLEKEDREGALSWELEFLSDVVEWGLKGGPFGSSLEMNEVSGPCRSIPEMKKRGSSSGLGQA